MKQDVILIASSIMILIMVIVNLSSAIDNHTFQDEMRAFKNKGKRNTSDMGRDLCDRVTVLEFHLKEDVQLTDCDEVYR